VIGNDIIDIQLTKAKTDWQRPGFLNKIFTTQEQEYIDRAKDPFLSVWTLWSIKESAYKLNMKYDTRRKFNPIKIECHVSNNQTSLVSIGIRKFFAKTLKTRDYIYSYALENLQDNLTHCIKELTTQDKQSHYCNELVANAIANKLSLNYNEVIIRKSKNGKPEVYNHNIKLNTHVSISHHGKYAAYSILDLE